ncbi:MAG: CMGC protein kinase, partial [Amphiamblys sp. WSBS2006]
EIKALEQLDHKNIVKMIANNLGARSKDGPVHIVLEHMPCDLKYAALSLPGTKENIREILHQVLSGVAHIHSKKMVHGDIKPENILIDPKTMAVKICDFGCCRNVEEETFPGESMGWCRQDISSIVDLMAYLYLGKSFPYWISLRMSSMDEVGCFFEEQKSGMILNNRVGVLYQKMGGFVSENGLDLFLELLASERTGGCTAAAEVLEHPFFAEGREQDPLPSKPKQRLLFS